MAKPSHGYDYVCLDLWDGLAIRGTNSLLCFLTLGKNGPNQFPRNHAKHRRDQEVWILGISLALSRNKGNVIVFPTNREEPKITLEERLRMTNWMDTNCQYYGSYWYRRNKVVFSTHPDYRRVPTYEDALRTKAQ